MKGGISKGTLATAVLVVGAVKLVQYYRQFRRKRQALEWLIPQSQVVDGNVTFERFGSYVVRQLGLDEDTPSARRLAKVAEDYIRGDKSNSDNSLDKLFDYLTRVCTLITQEQIQWIQDQIANELDVCMITYFSFHWNYNAKIINQVITGGMKKKKSFKAAVLTATRKQRFQRAETELKAQRWFYNILERMKAMKKHSSKDVDNGNVLVPAHSSVRSPVLLFIGGGMGAGKSTVVREIMEGPFWKSVASEAVVVEADAFKESDVLYRALSKMSDGQNISEAAELVHESSTNAASSLLVTALNEGRDVILDGTMSWEPFVTQTIAMARDVHNNHYRMGPGYGRNSDGTLFENYWEAVEDWEMPVDSDEPTPTGKIGDLIDGTSNGPTGKPRPVNERKPYRLEFVGVVCDAHIAVVRGMRRAIITNRGVPVKGQLRSHKLFTASIERYSKLMDHVKIYSTTAMGSPPTLIAFKDGPYKLLKDCEEFSLLGDLMSLNIDATSIVDLYARCNKKWHDLALSPERTARQQLLHRKLSHPYLQRELSELDSGSSSSDSHHGGSGRASNGSSHGTDTNGDDNKTDEARTGTTGDADSTNGNR